MTPHPSEISKEANTGIAQVVLNWDSLLLQHGIEVVPKDHPAQVSIGHAASNPAADINVSHGLLWTGEMELGQYGFEVNRDLITAAKNARRVIVPSQWVADVYRRDMHLNPIVVRHGVNVHEWHPREHKGYVLYTKNRKSDGLNPAAVNMLAREMPSVSFVTTFATRESPPNVHTLGGAVPHQEMRQRIQAAAVVIMLDRETWGIAAAEALAAGVPVVTTDKGAVKDFVIHGQTGYIYRDRGLLDVLQGINFCLDNRTVLGHNARKYAEENLTWDAPIAQIAEVIRQVAYEKQNERVPTISVVITSHNYGNRVGKAIDSVRTQSERVDEIVVIDDSSIEEDETFLVTSQYNGKPGPTVTYERVEFGNVALSRNRGIALSSGDFVVSLDGDDTIGPDWVRDCLGKLQVNPSAGFAYSFSHVFTSDGTEIVPPELIEHFPSAHPRDRDWPTEDHDKQFLPGVGNQYPGSAVMFRREALRRTGGYRPRYCPLGAGTEDANLYLRLLSLGWSGVRTDPTPNNLWTHFHGSGHVSGTPGYEEIDWRAWHPWTRDWQFPMAAVATPKNLSHPVRSYEPEVSVIIPVGPLHETSLMTALDSVEAQENRNWEIVVVWDYTPSSDIQQWYEDAYPFVTWAFSNGTGPGRARNIGVSAARADYVTFLDADDYYSPEFLKFVNPQVSRSTQSVVYSQYYGQMTHQQHGEFGGSIVREMGDRVIVEYAFRQYDRVRAHMRPSGDRPYVWSGVNVLVHKDWHRAIGGFREDMASWEDCLYLYRLAWAGYKFKMIEQPLWVYNFSEGRRREASRGSEPGLMVLLQEEFDHAMISAYEQDEREEYAL